MKIYFIVLFFMSSANAGLVKENGGNTVICKVNQVMSSYQLLDFFEATQTISTGKLHFESSIGNSRIDNLAEVLEIIRSVSDSKYKVYSEWLHTFEAEAVFLSNINLGVVSDSYHFVIPKNCKVVQTVVQIQPIFHESRYTIDKNIWDQLSPLDQAGLVIHELIYREFQNAPDSRKTRAINAFLFSDEIKLMNLDHKKQILNNLGF